MNAIQKVAWVELVVSIVALLVVLAFYPWLGQLAIGGFGLLCLLGITSLLTRKRGDQVVKDERDDEIERRSSWFGFRTGWYLTLLSLAVMVLWHNHHSRDVPTEFLSAFIGGQMALYYAIKAATSFIQYRGTSRAA